MSDTLLLINALKNYDSDDNIKLLIEKVADINAINKAGETLLMIALDNNASYNIIKLLIEKRINVNAKDKKDITVLMFALVNNASEQIIKLLIEKEVDVNAKDIYDRTVLEHAIETVVELEEEDYSEKNIALIIEKVTNINAKNKDGKTILMRLFEIGPSERKQVFEIFKLLINKGADVNAKDNNGRTVLMYGLIESEFENFSNSESESINDNSTKIIKFIIKSGADVNAKFGDGKTILMFALEYNASDNIIKLLITKIANINAIDNECNNALYYANKFEYSDEIIQLISNKSKKSKKSNKSSTILSRSKYDSNSNNNTLCNTLFEEFSDINLKKNLIFLCNKTNLTEETNLNASETKKIFKQLKEERQNRKKIILNDVDKELDKIDITNSNNIDNYYIQYPGPGIDEGGLSKQFFTNAMEQMFTEYFILIEGTNKFKLKDSITKEEASKAGFLVAFSLMNDMPLIKHINNIYIGMTMYKVKQLVADDYFLYAILDMNEEGQKNFQNICADANLLDEFCNPTKYYDDYILLNYGLKNKNLSVFIKTFNKQITKKILRTNKINIYDISKILTNTKITKKELILLFDTIKRNKHTTDVKWIKMYDIFRYLMINLTLAQYTEWLQKYGTPFQKKELSSIHKFYQKVFFFWTSLNTINTNMTPYYSIHYTSTRTLLPLSHTCFNQLDIPEYKNAEEMFKYLINAIFEKDFDRM
jgi:ankyrin repeat protein